MSSSSAPVADDKTRPEEAKHPVDTLVELRSIVARLNARTAALHRDINALSLFVRNTQVVHTELMTRLCDQVFRISDALHLLPVAHPDEDSDRSNNQEEEEEEQGGVPFDDVYRDQIL